MSQLLGSLFVSVHHLQHVSKVKRKILDNSQIPSLDAFILRENDWTMQVSKCEDSQLKEWEIASCHCKYYLDSEKQHGREMFLYYSSSQKFSGDHLWPLRHFQGVHEKKKYFHNNHKSFLPFTLLFSQECTVEFYRSYTLCDTTTD